MIPPSVYLAGPGVFRPNADAIGQQLKELCRHNGLEGLWPGDGCHIDPEIAEFKRARAQLIFETNAVKIRSADAVLLDMTPFRGPHMDVGTAWESGFARALRKPLVGYVAGHVAGAAGELRVSALTDRIWCEESPTGWRDAHGDLVEDFDLPENLMIGCSVLKVWGSAALAIRHCAEILGSDPGMSARTIFITASGRGVDLLNPSPADINWDVFAEHLAKEIRFNGATPDVMYSVAEHCARGADAVLKESGDREVAAYFLTHDGPEHLLKDDPTPKKHALAEIAFAKFGILAPQILACFADLTERHDVAVHTAAGLAWPPPPEVAELIKHWDRRMLVTEWRDLMHGVAHPYWEEYRDIPPLPDVIVPWRWQTAKFALLNRCHALLPALRVPSYAHHKTRSTSA